MISGNGPAIAEEVLPYQTQKRHIWFRTLLQKYIPIPIATAVLFTLVWAGWLLIRQPYNGIIWSYQTGSVLDVDPQGPAYSYLEPGDLILSIDGIEPYQARGLPNRQPGDIVEFTFVRAMENLDAQVLLVKAPPKVLFNRLSTLLVAMPFWLLGVLVVAFSQQDRSSVLFFFVSHILAIVLSLGSISAYAPLWCGWLFSLMLWWIGPLVLHTHLILARPATVNNRASLLISVYLLAFVFTLVDIDRLSSATPGPFVNVKNAWLALSLVASALILIHASLTGKPIELRRKMRIAGLSALVAFLPFVLFSLIPNALVGRYILPYEVSFLALPVLPLGYSYAILRYKLIQFERYVNRSFAYALVVLVIGAAYGTVYLIVPHILPGSSEGVSIIGFGTALLLMIGAHPLHTVLQRWVDKLFYGGWYDDRVLVKQVSRALTQAEGDASSIASTLCQALQKTLRLEYATLILSDGRVISTAPLPRQLNNGSLVDEESNVVRLFEELQRKVGREIGAGYELISVLHSLDYRKRWIIGRKPHFWLLLNGKHTYRGLLILGDRYGGGEFAPRDLEILEVVIRQAGAALENEFLLEEVRQRSAQVKDLHRQVLMARDEERKRVARDLHDKIVQALVGINYQMSNIRIRVNDELTQEFTTLHTELRQIIGDLRQVCADLRPPSLDVLGLIPAIHSHIAELQARVPFEIELCVDDPDILDVPEDVTLCIYRFFQEAILNIQKHAGASIVSVCFTLSSDDRFTLSITDNGRGFQPPTNLGVLVQTRHFGLVGLEEQVEAIGGTLTIQSAPGAGCCITASVPINRKNNF